MTNTTNASAPNSSARLRISAIPPLTLCELSKLDFPSNETPSPFCLKVHRALKARGLTYERRHSNNPASYKPLNPAAQAPVLLVGDEPVFDSTKILARLEEMAPDPKGPGANANPRLIAESLLWEELADSAVNAFLVASRWADDRNWPTVREQYFGAMPALLKPIITGKLRSNVIANLRAREVWRLGPEDCWRRFEALLDQLDARAPASGYWLGEYRTAADFALFGQLHSLRTPLTQWQSDQVALRKNLSAYLDRIDAETREIVIAKAA